MRVLWCLAGWWMAGATLWAETAQPEVWLRDLASEVFKTREEAETALRAWAEQQPDKAQELFLKQMEQSPDPETRMRCRALVKHVVLMEYRKQGEGYVGIQMREERLAEALPRFGIRVAAVVPDTPAAKAGLQVGDLVLEFDGKGWTTEDAMTRFSAEIRKRRPGERVKMRIRRGAEDLEVEVELTRRPDMLNANNGFFFLGDGQIDPARLQAQAEERYFQEWLARRKEQPGAQASPSSGSSPP